MVQYIACNEHFQSRLSQPILAMESRFPILLCAFLSNATFPKAIANTWAMHAIETNQSTDPNTLKTHHQRTILLKRISVMMGFSNCSGNKLQKTAN